MGDGIFLIQNDGQLVEMNEATYDSEALLQELLATYPSLLAGSQINPGAPRRWLLIMREAGIASEEDGANRWSVDHLFLDQDGIPTLVEVKRSSDTRIRREVVGQMLDYAANAVVYWPIEKVRAYFEATCQLQTTDPDITLRDFLGEDTDPEAFWMQVKTNLEAQRIRMVFVADIIPPELRRIVEFLNTQMNPAEVLAVEIKQFTGQGLKTLVPRVLGQTAEAQQKKGSSPRERHQWDEGLFFPALETTDPAAIPVARALLDWGQRTSDYIWWGNGQQSGSFLPGILRDGVKHYPISVWTYGTVEINFQYLRTRPAFRDEAQRRTLRERLNQIPGVSIPEDGLTRRPNIKLATLADPQRLQQFIEVMDWVVLVIRAGATE